MSVAGDREEASARGAGEGAGDLALRVAGLQRDTPRGDGGTDRAVGMTYPDLAEGEHLLELRLTDEAGGSTFYDNRVEVWLAPALGHLPVRILWTQANGDVVDQRLASHTP